MVTATLFCTFVFRVHDPDLRRLHNYDSGHFEELSATRNLNDSHLLRFLPSVEMTNNGSCAKLSYLRSNT